MQDDLIGLEVALLAKKKRFSMNTTEYWQYNPSEAVRYELITEDMPGATWVNEDIKNRVARVTQSLLQKWLREVHKIDVFINKDRMFNKDTYCIFLHKNDTLRPLDNDTFSGYATYEEALEVGLLKALKLI
jgi:hypothetical protein